MDEYTPASQAYNAQPLPPQKITPPSFMLRSKMVHPGMPGAAAAPPPPAPGPTQLSPKQQGSSSNLKSLSSSGRSSSSRNIHLMAPPSQMPPPPPSENDIAPPGMPPPPAAAAAATGSQPPLSQSSPSCFPNSKRMVGPGGALPPQPSPLRGKSVVRGRCPPPPPSMQQQQQQLQYQQYQQQQQMYYQQDMQYQSPATSPSPSHPQQQVPLSVQKQAHQLHAQQVIPVYVMDKISAPPGLELPTIGHECEIDPVSRQILREAHLSESAFIRALESLEEGYHVPLQTKLGPLAAQDLNTIFGGVGGLLSASRAVIEKINAVATHGKPYYLASLYIESRDYISAYSAFLSAHNEGVLRLFTQLHGESSGFKKAVDECGSAEFPGATIMDLFWLVVSRLKYIKQLAQAQLSVRRTIDEAHQQIESIIRFQASRLSGDTSSPINVTWKYGPCARQSEIRRAEDDLKKFTNGLVAESEALSGMHESAGLVREIRYTGNERIPPSLKRKLLDQVEVVMQNKTAFGLSTEVPAVLMFFSDGVALCLPENGKCRFKLVHWYTNADLIVTDTRGSTEELTFRIARKIPTGEKQILPPGWEDVPKGNGKHTYVNKYLNKTQSQRPECITPCEAVQHILTGDSEVYDKCVSRIREATGGVGLVAESTPVPYVMIGSKLDLLLAHEQTLYPGITVPILPKLICHHIISYGLGEQGLFRVAAQKHSIESTCQLINTGHLREIDFSKENIHLVTSMLKMFLRDMPEPLIPAAQYFDFMSVYKIENPAEKMARLAHYISLMPRPNRDLLYEILSFEFQIAANTHVNSMDTMNLAIVTAPNILYTKGAKEDIAAITTSNYVVDFMIAHYKELFDAAALESTEDNLPAGSEGEYDWVSFKRKLIGHTKGIRILSRCADGVHMLSVDGDGKGFVWNANECSYVKEVDLGLKYPSAVVLVGNNFWIATQDAIFVIDSTTHTKIAQILVGAFALALSPDGREVWCGTEGKIVVIDTTTFQTRAEIPIAKQAVFFSIISVGTTFWCAGHSRGMEQSIYVFDGATRTELTKFPAHSKKINALHLVGDHTVWSGSDDFSICIWNTKTYALEEKLVKHSGAVFGFCALKDQVWSCSWDKTIMIWEPKTFKYLGEIKGYHTDSVVALVPVDRGTTVDVWSQSHDKALCVWSVRPAPVVVSLH